MLYLGYTLVLKRQELVSSSKGLMYLSDSWQEVAEWPWGAGLLAWQHPKSKLCTAMKLALVWPLALGCCFTLGEHQWSEQICTCIWKWPLLQEQITNCQKHSTLQWRTENNALFYYLSAKHAKASWSRAHQGIMTTCRSEQRWEGSPKVQELKVLFHNQSFEMSKMKRQLSTLCSSHLGRQTGGCLHSGNC